MDREIARLYAVIGANISELQRKLGEAAGGIDHFRKQTEGAGSGVDSFFQRVASTATGVIGARFFERIADQIAGIGRSALNAAANFQTMQVGLEGLMAREIAKGEKVTETYTVVAGVSEKMAKKNAQLNEKQAKLAAQIANYEESLAIAQQRLVEYQGKEKVAESTMMSATKAVGDWQEKLTGAHQELAKVNAQLADNTAAAMATSTATRTIYTNQKTLAEAMPEAQIKAKALMDELSRIALLSPYQLETINNTFRQAMVFGYTSDEATKFTKAILNVAAGTGATNEILERMAYNFAQIRMVGKVTAVDMRQLAMAGFDLTSVLQYAGERAGIVVNNYEDFNNAIAAGKITWEEFTDSFAEYADKNFGGASERMSTTINGLKNTMGDLFNLTMPQVVLPALNEVNVRLSDFLNLFLEVRESGVLEKVGEGLRDKVARWLQPVDKILSNINKWREGPKLLNELRKAARLDPDAVEEYEKLRKEQDDLSRGAGVLGVVLNSLFGPTNADRIIGVVRRLRDGYGKLRDVLGEVASGDWRGALKELGAPDWSFTLVERGIDLFGRLKDTVVEISKGNWKEALSGLGFSPGVIEGISKVAEGYGTIWDTIRKVFDLGSLSAELDKIFAPKSKGPSNAPDWLKTRLGISDEGSQLMAMGMRIAGELIDGIMRGLVKVSEGAVKLTDELLKWSAAPETQEELQRVAAKITSKIIEEIKVLFDNEKDGESMLRALLTNLGKAVVNLHLSVMAIGQSIAMGVVEGFVQGILGQEAARRFQGGISQFYQQQQHARETGGTFLPGTGGQYYDPRTTNSGGAGGVPSYAQGGSFVTNGPQLILVGDNRSGRERVDVTPLGPGNRGKAAPVINISIDARGADPKKVQEAAHRGVRQALRAEGWA